MGIKQIPSFNGGQVENVREDLLQDNQLQECFNYEMIKEGILQLRKDTESFDADIKTDMGVGPDKITDGTFPNGTAWITTVGHWTFASNKATHVTGNTTALEQDSVVDKVGTWRVEFTITGVTAGSVTPSLADESGTTVGENDTFTQDIEINETDLAASDSIKFTPTSDFNGEISVVSVSFVLGTIYENIKAFWVWNPKTLPENCNKNYVFVLYVDSDSVIDDLDGEIYVLMHDSTTEKWDLQNSGNALFTGMNRPVACVNNYGLVLVDGRHGNTAKYIAYNSDQELNYGDIGVARPLNMPSINSDDAYNDFSDDDDEANPGMTIPRGSIVQYAFTQVTDDGIESNPSPVYSFTDLQNQYKGTDESGSYVYDEELHGFWVKTRVEDLLANYISSNSNLATRLKYFKIYRRHCPYTGSAIGISNWSLIDTIAIADIEDNMNYTDTQPPGLTSLSFENDTSCKGSDVCYSGGITFIANSNSSIKFPFDFAYYCPITIQNKNNNNYVNAVIHIRLYDENSTETNKVDYFDVTDYFPDASGHLDTGAENKLRFFDTDLYTPLACCFLESLTTDKYRDVFIKVPYIAANSNHVVYFCFDPDDEIIDNATWQDPAYGEWVNIIDDASDQAVFGYCRVRDENTLLCMSDSESFENGVSTEIKNMANVNYSFTNASPGVTTSNAYVTYMLNSVYIADGSLAALAAQIDAATSKQMNCQMPENVFEDKGWMAFVVEVTTYPSTASHGEPVLSLKDATSGSTNNLDLYLQHDNVNDKIIFWVNRYYSSTDHWVDMDMDISITSSPPGQGEEIFILLSWDDDEVFLFANNSDQEESQSSTKAIGSNSFSDIEYIVSDNSLGSTWDYEISQIQLSNGTYISTELEAIQVQNNMPLYPEEHIGWHLDDTENKNISFGESLEVAYEDPEGIIRYGDLVFPDGNYISTPDWIGKMIPMKSFYNQQYKNTLLLFGRDYIRRLVLSGDSSGWNASISDNLIEEHVHYGLSDELSIVEVDGQIFWHSEIGFMAYSQSMDKPICISKGFIDGAAISLYSFSGIYVPIRNQILWHYRDSEDSNNNITYVFDISRKVFYRFYGLDILWSDVIIGDEDDDYLNIFLCEESGDSVLMKYPGTSNTTDPNSQIKTKKFPLGYARLKRIMADWTGTIDIEAEVYNEQYTSNPKSTKDASTDPLETMTANKWRQFPGGYIGDHAIFTIMSATELKQLAFETITRGR